MKYWFRRDTGALVAEGPNITSRAHSEYELTPDVASLPGPMRVCKWDGSQIVIDPSRLADYKGALRRIVEDKYFASVQEGVLSTPFGDFRVRKDDIDAYLMIGFSAIYAIQTGGAFSVTLRRADDSTVTVNATQFIRFLALIGDRIAARLAARDAKLDALAAATPDQLKVFSP